MCSDSLTVLNDTQGLIQSPNFPIYSMLTKECFVNIIAPIDKVIKMWVFVDINATNK